MSALVNHMTEVDPYETFIISITRSSFTIGRRLMNHRRMHRGQLYRSVRVRNALLSCLSPTMLIWV